MAFTPTSSRASSSYFLRPRKITDEEEAENAKKIKDCNKIIEDLKKSTNRYKEWTTHLAQKNQEWEAFAKEELENKENAIRVKDEPIVIDEERKAMAIKRTKKMVKFQMDSATSSKDATAKINAPFKRIDFDQFLESVKAKYENEIGTKKHSSLAELEATKKELVNLKRMDKKLDKQIKIAKAKLKKRSEAVDAELDYMDKMCARLGLIANNTNDANANMKE